MELIEQMYEGTAGCINDVFQAMDEVMKKENSLFREHTASVAQSLDEMTKTFRAQMASHKQLFERTGFSHVTYFNDILRIDNDLHDNLHEHVPPALRYIADMLQNLSQGEQDRSSTLTVLQNTLAIHMGSVEKLSKPDPPPAPASSSTPEMREVTLSDERVIQVHCDGEAEQPP